MVYLPPIADRASWVNLARFLLRLVLNSRSRGGAICSGPPAVRGPSRPNRTPPRTPDATRRRSPGPRLEDLRLPPFAVPPPVTASPCACASAWLPTDPEVDGVRIDPVASPGPPDRSGPSQDLRGPGHVPGEPQVVLRASWRGDGIRVCRPRPVELELPGVRAVDRRDRDVRRQVPDQVLRVRPQPRLEARHVFSCPGRSRISRNRKLTSSCALAVSLMTASACPGSTTNGSAA